MRARESSPPLDQALRAYLARNEARLLATLRAYVDCGGVSATGEGIERAVEHVCELLRDVGAEPRLHAGARHPLVLARTEHDPRKPTAIVYGHYDVQPVGPLERWTSPPFASEIRNGRVYGRGTVDNKGQHLAHVLALGALRELTGELPCNVVFVLDGEEETGSAGLPDVVRAHADALAADVAIWSDGPVRDAQRPGIALGVRGVVIFELRCRGARTPLHSGNAGGVAPNPAWTLVWLLASMQGPDGELAIDGIAETVPALSPALRSALASIDVPIEAMCERLGVAQLAPPSRRGVALRLAGVPSLSINRLLAGGEDDARTVIPNEALACCDIRLVPGQRVERTLELLRAHVARHAPDVELTVTGTMEPSGTDPESPWVAAVRAGVRQAHGEDPLVVPALGGSLPLFVFTDILELPCVGVPLGNPDGHNHAPDENFEVRRFLDGILASALVLEALGHVPRS